MEAYVSYTTSLSEISLHINFQVDCIQFVNGVYSRRSGPFHTRTLYNAHEVVSHAEHDIPLWDRLCTPQVYSSFYVMKTKIKYIFITET